MLRTHFARLTALFVLSLFSFTTLAQETVNTVRVKSSVNDQDRTPASDDATELDTLEVTGSRIKRTDYETSQPVLSIGREAIERTGLTSIGDLIQNLATAGSALNTTNNNGGNGSVEVDLRNLGSARTLVLVNGRRWVNGLRTNSSASVDLNTIPVSVIERVEVLKDGASAVYGSDAVAGVINIITRNNYQGVDLRSQIGGYLEDGDGQTQQHSVSIGSLAGATSVYTDISYTRQDPVMAGNRAIARVPQFGTGNTRGSSATPQGRFLFIPDPAVVTHPCAADGICNLTLIDGEDGVEQSDFRNFTADDRYNFAPLNYILTPNERTSIFSAVSHDFGNVLFNNPVSFQGEFLYNIRKSAQQLAETPLFVGDLAGPPFDTLYVAADQIFNPFDQDLGRAFGPNGEGSAFIGRRFTELGTRNFSQTVDTYRFGGGFKGNFDVLGSFMSWESGLTFAESRNAGKTEGLLNLDRIRTALGPAAACTGTCVPLNLFGGQLGGGSITPDQLAYVAYTGQDSTKQTQRTAYLYMSNELFNLPAGPVGAAYGLEARRDSFQDTPDPLVQASASSTNRALPTKGSLDVKEAYVEFNVPVLSGVYLADALDLSLAARYSDYDLFGEDTNYKFGVRWKPYADLLVRGTVSTAFRAPSVSDLFLGLSDSNPGVGDPCSDYTGAGGGAPASAEVQANCTADGVPATYSQINPQLLERQGGNPDLTPEEADTFTAGLVFSPEFVPDLNVYLDWYRIELTNAITTLGSETILNNCYGTAERSSTCAFITRDGSGNIKEIQNLFVNIGAIDVEGIDFAFDYTLPALRYLEGLGTFKIAMDSAYLIEYTEFVATADGSLAPDSLAGTNDGQGPNAFPRFKANTDLLWNLGAMRASWTVRYIGKMKENCDDGINPPLYTFGQCSNVQFGPDGDGDGEPDSVTTSNELGQTFYHDVQFGYNFADDNFDVTVGVNNVLDKDPPVSTSAFANSYDVQTYDVPGRFPYLRLRKSF